VTPGAGAFGAVARPTARRPSVFRKPSQSPTITSRFFGAVAVTAGENIETAIVAATSGWSSAKRTTTSEAMEWPSTASRPSPRGRAAAATAARLFSSTRVAPSIFVRSPVSGAGLRP
jgi:hypothetical protein